MSAFWLPVGVRRLDTPLVIGPLSGGTLTPRSLARYLGLRGMALDGARLITGRLGGILARVSWGGDVRFVLAQNEATRAYLDRWVVAPGVPVQVHSHASDPDLGDVVGTETDGQRSADILFVGRLVAWKGVRLALEAFAEADVPSASLIFIGSGPERRPLQGLASKLGLAERVHFLGSVRRSEVLARMRSSAALLFPSFHDSAGFVISEALSLGLPVICLDHGGPGTLVKLWPTAPHAAIPATTAAETSRRLAGAIEDFVRDPAPIRSRNQEADVSLTTVIGAAYRAAAEAPA